MDKNMKIILGAVLGYAGYMAYKKLQSTQTIVVSDLGPGASVPEILSVSQPGMQPAYDFSNMAGMGRRRR